ncbi:MAG: NAD(P)H-dependent oxidoreductase [Bacteroidetes bacterium]|nr:NAD(P)H-dependent oxidoreductase [Bacteroidota bacterium]
MNIEIISGSPREDSLSYRIAQHLQQELHLCAAKHPTGLINLQQTQIPFIQKVWSSQDAVPPEYKELGRRMFGAQAFIIVSPEYNGGYSPAMKNLFDHFPKQRRKAFGICTGSDGALGGMRAAQQLLQLVPALFGIASPTLLIVPNMDLKFEAGGRLSDAAFCKRIHDFLTDFLWLAEALQSGKEDSRS